MTEDWIRSELSTNYWMAMPVDSVVKRRRTVSMHTTKEDARRYVRKFFKDEGRTGRALIRKSTTMARTYIGS